MKVLGTLAIAVLVLAPSVAQAQKPSSNMHTRSAEVYLDQAANQKVAADRKVAFEKALAAALEGTKNDPDNPLSWFQAGQAYAGLGDFVGADSALDRAEKLYPEYVRETQSIRLNGWISQYNAAVTALQSNEVTTAIQALETADRLYRGRPEALVTLGSVYVQTGDLARAEEIFKAALAVIRGPERAKLNDEQKKSWAEDELSVSMRLANIYAELGRNEEAEKVYRELLQSQPDNNMARANLAVVLSRAGKAADATALYNELLQRDDLSEATLFNTGIGLFRAEEYDRAAVAFRRSVELSPFSHDALYNLAQSLFAHSAELEKEMEAAAAPRKAEIATQLASLAEEMRVTAERLHEIDPTNRNVLMMLAQAQRTLAEVAGEGAAGTEWRNKALATLEKHKALPFEVTSIAVIPGETEVQVTGMLTNLNAAAGSPIRLQFVVLNREGAELMTQDIQVTAPATSENARFDATIKVPEGAAAWKYRIIS